MRGNDMKLYCSCCGDYFTADNQFHDHDLGFGTCRKCCAWILGRVKWAYDWPRIRNLIAAQWAQS